MALGSQPRLAWFGLRKVHRSPKHFPCRTFAASAVGSREAWGIQIDSSEHTTTESNLALRQNIQKPPDNPVPAEDRSPPPRVRAGNKDSQSNTLDRDPPIRFHKITRQRDSQGSRERESSDNSLNGGNPIQTKERTEQAKTHPGSIGKKQRIASTDAKESGSASSVRIFVDGQRLFFSPILLRDLCKCASCLDPSTRQKLFSTADIPSNIKSRAVVPTTSGVTVHWVHDISGYGEDHATTLDVDTIRSLRDHGAAPSADMPSYQPGKQLIWDAQQYRQLEDIDYEAYMQDDSTLFRALQQLHTHGLLFLQNVPEDEKSVSTVGERIGAVKNTFYGYTWDVRSVPEAKNVAYTSQNLGFHMDLMYMRQPPHLQLLHCIRSSAAGGASLFVDSYKAAADLFKDDPDAFLVLASMQASFHYNHAASHLYHQDRPIFQMNRPNREFPGFLALAKSYRDSTGHNQLQSARARAIIASFQSGETDIVDYIQNVAWAPPFQAPLRLIMSKAREANASPWNGLNVKVARWHSAAQKFSALIHREQGVYERLMKPGECVIFDNRRVLHARRAFEVGDAGKERWLRGAYLDWDPYWSKMSVLGKKFGNAA